METDDVQYFLDFFEEVSDKATFLKLFLEDYVDSRNIYYSIEYATQTLGSELEKQEYN